MHRGSPSTSPTSDRFRRLRRCLGADSISSRVLHFLVSSGSVGMRDQSAGATSFPWGQGPGGSRIFVALPMWT